MASPHSDGATPRPVAGNGLLDRRLFLGGGAALAGALLTPCPVNADPRAALAPTQRVPGRPFTNYGQPSAHERDVIRWVSANGAAPANGISWCPLHELDGTLTPNGLHFERHHNGIPDIDPAAHRLAIVGQVARPLSYDMSALLRYPRETRQCFVECGGNSNAGWRRKPVQVAAGYFHGLASCSEWTGVPVRWLLEEAGVEPDAAWVIAEGADAFSLTMSLPLAKVREDCLLALFQNGERLRPEQGYPLRLLVPGWEGVLNVKWLKTLMLSDKPAMARNETAKYSELGPDGRARMFSFTLGPKSLITTPSSGMRLPEAGFYEISGLAWSGHGRVASVEVSADGGASWAPAALTEPVLPQCFTRFRVPWRWDGGPAVLQSRVRDERGNEQPTRRALLATLGRSAYYHYHAIVSWAVESSGAVTHTYVDADPGEAPLDDLFMDDTWD